MPVYPYYDTETNGFVYHVASDPSGYSNGSISDITSEAESSASGTTISSDDLSEYFVDHYGRQQPASEGALRWFPSDSTRRHILRHVLRKYIFGCNYAGPVREMLWPDLGEGKSYHVLEIGTRDGTWTQEMATEFPHVQFRSVDIAPMIAHPPRPNIVFEVYDITGRLLVEDGSQDIVFVNLAIELVRDYRALLLEVHRVLRPGGLIHLHEYTPGLWDSQDDTKPAIRTNPLGCRHFDLVRNSIARLGVDPDTCEKLPQWLASGSDLWVGEHTKGFEWIHSVVRKYPAYPHDGRPCSSKFDPRLAPLLGHLSVVSTRDSFGLLRDTGLSAEDADSRIEAMIEELKDPDKCAVLKVYYIYATKKR